MDGAEYLRKGGASASSAAPFGSEEAEVRPLRILLQCKRIRRGSSRREGKGRAGEKKKGKKGVA